MNTTWKPSASMEHLKQRAIWMQKIRQFFTSRGYWEVETPILGEYGITDPYLQNIYANFRNKPYALQTSPEYPMKRLLAAGSGSIFQIARVFRDDELGRWHNPEFTLLEWYQLDVDHHGLLAEVETLFQTLFACPPFLKLTYQASFLAACNLDPMTATIEDFKDTLQAYDLHHVLPDDETDRDQYLFLLMSHVVEPWFAMQDKPIAVTDFPASQAALAQVRLGVAERFEIYYRGIELANGFHELTDVDSQRARFEVDCAIRTARRLTHATPDVNLLACLEAGLPACSGVALGLDRLFALMLGRKNISEVMAFDFNRA